MEDTASMGQIFCFAVLSCGDVCSEIFCAGGLVGWTGSPSAWYWCWWEGDLKGEVVLREAQS